MLHWNFLRDTKSSFQEAPGSMQHYMVLKGERACFLRNSFPGDGSWATGPWQMVAHHYDAGLQTQSKLEYFPHPTHRFPGEGWGLCSDLLGLVLNLIGWETNSDVSGALLLSTTFLAGWLTDFSRTQWRSIFHCLLCLGKMILPRNRASGWGSGHQDKPFL